jgi:hypothetical protein
MIKELFKKQIHVTHIGNSLIDYKERFVLQHSLLDDGAIDSVLAINEAHVLSNTDKLFFMPGCTVPRFKVKQYCTATGMSVSKTPANANVIIKGDDTEREIIREEYSSYNVSVSSFKKWLIKNWSEEEEEGLIDASHVKALLTLLDSSDLYHMVSLDGWSEQAQLTDVNKDWVFQLKENAIVSHKIWISTEKALTDFEDIVLSGKPIVYQDTLLQLINENTVMDREMHDETVKMFESKDTNNHVLAMEVMANCNYEKSALYLLHLFKECRSEIYDRKERNHVNFQGLCKFFDIEPGCNYTLDDIIKIAKEKNLITADQVPTLMHLAKDELEADLNSDHFQVSGIEMNDDLSQAIERADQLRLAKLSSTPTVSQDLNNL